MRPAQAPLMNCPRSRQACSSRDASLRLSLPRAAAKIYTLTSPFKDQQLEVTKLVTGEETTFKLKPFEVLVIEALPEETPAKHL